MSETASTGAHVERMTLDEWAALSEDDPRELVDGHLEEQEAPENVHELVVAWLIRVLGSWGAPRKAIVLGSGSKFVVTRDRGRMPDVSIFLPGSARPPKVGLNRAPPSIAIEVVSSTPRDARRDRIEKLGEYAAFRVRWYWIVDPALRSLQVHELNADGRYVHVLDVTGGVVDAVPGCEGLTLDVTELWSEVDALGD